MSNFLKHLEHIARHAVGIAEQGIGTAVGDAVNVASAAANIAGEAANIAGNIAGGAVGVAVGGTATIVGEAAKISGDAAGGAISGAVNIASAVKNISGEAAKIAENIATGATKDAVSAVGDAVNIASIAANIAGEAAKIIGDVAEGTVGVAIGGAATIVGEAAKIAGEAAKIAGDAAGGTIGGAINVASTAANIAGEAAKIAENVATGATEDAVEGAAKIAAQAAQITGDVAGGAVGVAAGGAATIVGEAAKIAGEAAKIAGDAAGGAANAAEHLANIAGHVTTIAGHVTTIAGGVTGDAIIAGKALATQGAANIFKQWADKDVVLNTAKDIFEEGSENAARDLVTAAKSRALSLITEDELLKDVADIFQKANDEAIRNTAFAITRRTFWAMRPYLGKAPAIYEGVFSNAANWETLQYILSNWSILAEFLIDLVEPAKLYAMGNSRDDKPSKDEMDRNKYNELDLNKPMNRHAVICQFQRLAKSLVVVLKDGQGEGLDRFKMDTKLDTDNGDMESKKQGYDFEGKATWFFVNGIAGEPYWLRLACDKLEDTFKRKVQGVFNRSEGIMWDLIECAGERDSDGGPKGLIRGLIKRTESSLEAQRKLKEQLVAVLGNNEQSKIIVIAHSQGCLILRLVLEQLAEEPSQTVLSNMKQRLRVFTFGNPSIAWAVHEYCDHTEHFANRKDFVAQLGVLGHSNDYQGQIFINETWTGHLFGSQYSLKAQDYGINKEDSELFACAGNTPRKRSIRFCCSKRCPSQPMV